jgi:hypothetical protein
MLACLARPDYICVMTNQEKTKISLHAAQVFHGQTIRQELPLCDCGKFYDEKGLGDAPGVFFKDVEVFGKIFTLIEPVCPVCNRKIAARFSVLN